MGKSISLSIFSNQFRPATITKLPLILHNKNEVDKNISNKIKKNIPNTKI